MLYEPLDSAQGPSHAITWELRGRQFSARPLSFLLRSPALPELSEAPAPTGPCLGELCPGEPTPGELQDLARALDTWAVSTPQQRPQYGLGEAWELQKHGEIKWSHYPGCHGPFQQLRPQQPGDGTAEVLQPLPWSPVLLGGCTRRTDGP